MIVQLNEEEMKVYEVLTDLGISESVVFMHLLEIGEIFIVSDEEEEVEEEVTESEEEEGIEEMVE